MRSLWRGHFLVITWRAKGFEGAEVKVWGVLVAKLALEFSYIEKNKDRILGFRFWLIWV